MSDAVSLFLGRVVTNHALPVEIKSPNAVRQVAIEVSRMMLSKRKSRLVNADALPACLEKVTSSEPVPLPWAANSTKIFLQDQTRHSHSGRQKFLFFINHRQNHLDT